MAWPLDATSPSDSDLDGTAAEAIRNLKTDLNLLDTRVLDATGDPAGLRCIQGWPRTFSPADAAALAALAAGTVGRLAWQVDTRALYHDSGSAWERVRPGPFDLRIPLTLAPYKYTASGYVNLYPSYVCDGTVWQGVAWGANKGDKFNKAYYPTGATVKFGVLAKCDVAGATVVLADYTAGAATLVTGGSLTLTTSYEWIESADLAAALTAGDRVYILKGLRGTSNAYEVGAAYLRVQLA